MSRSLAPMFVGVALLLGLPTVAVAQDTGDAATNKDLTDPDALRQERIRLYQEAAAKAKKDGDLDSAQKYLGEAQKLAQQGQDAKSKGISGKLDEAMREREEARKDKMAEAEAERMKEMYDRPGFFDKLGQGLADMLVNAGGQFLNKFIDNLLNGGKDKENQELLDQINRLQEERDDLLNGTDDGSGLGNIITDSNGNYGYDRDGDGFVDIPLDSGNNPGDYNPTNNNAYGAVPNDPYNGLSNPFDDDDDDDKPLPGFAGGGGASMGGGGGAGMSGMPAGGGAAGGLNGAGDKGKAKDETDKLKKGKDGKDGSGDLAGAGKGKGKDKDGKSDDEDGETTTVIGMPIILPKLEFEDLAGDKKAKSDGWKDEWEDDGWDDKKDNGDKDDDWADDDDWGDEWDDKKKKKKKAAKPSGDKKKTSAEDKEAAELVDQIIRVETVIAEWRKIEKKAKAEGKDDQAYGFGYQASGDKKKDPLKDVRDKDGKIDLEKVEVWVIEKDSWKDKDQEPVRFRLKIGEDVKDFDPTHGGVVVLKGVVKALKVDKRVLEEIKGKVKEIEVASVILSAEKPPADFDSLDPDKEPDVGGLDDDKDSSKKTKTKKSETKKSDKKKDDDWDDDEDW